MSTASIVSPKLDRALSALRRALQGVDGGHANPVGGSRALQRVATCHPLDYEGQREAFLWEAEKLMRPYFADMTTDQAARALVWLALDAAWARGGRHRG